MNGIKKDVSKIMKNDLSKIIRDWVTQNKTVFWKYEVSSFHRTYKINVRNLPRPEKEDISISKHNQLLNNSEKTQLCSSIKKACAKLKAFNISCIDVEVNYLNGEITADVVSSGCKI